MNTTNTITPFLFGESTIRTIIRDNEPWFVAKDVCTTLGITNYRQAISGNEQSGALGLDDDEKGVYNLDTLGGAQDHIIINESGLYTLIFKSRKAEAKAFRKWVTSEVLPTLRKRGFYGNREQAVTLFLRELLDMGLTSRDAAKITLASFPPITRHEQRMEELRKANENANATPALSPENEVFLLEMRPGVAYRIPDFLTMLPDRHPYKKLTTAGLRSNIGLQLQTLIGLGKVVKSTINRQAIYMLTETQSKIIPMSP